jgi:hypothetical protein
VALIECTECGNQISSLAAACPKCGAPTGTAQGVGTPATTAPSSNKGSKTTGCLTVIAAFVVIGLVSSSLEKCSGESTPSTPSTRDLNAVVHFSGGQFRILNKDAFRWGDCEVEVNSHGLSSGYVRENVTVLPGEEVVLGAMTFAKSDGERFNPFAYKPVQLTLSCTVEGGKGFTVVGWK